jgi:hypothetical protein
LDYRNSNKKNNDLVLSMQKYSLMNVLHIKFGFPKCGPQGLLPFLPLLGLLGFLKGPTIIATD